MEKDCVAVAQSAQRFSELTHDNVAKNIIITKCYERYMTSAKLQNINHIKRCWYHKRAMYFEFRHNLFSSIYILRMIYLCWLFEVFDGKNLYVYANVMCKYLSELMLYPNVLRHAFFSFVRSISAYIIVVAFEGSNPDKA